MGALKVGLNGCAVCIHYKRLGDGVLNGFVFRPNGGVFGLEASAGLQPPSSSPFVRKVFPPAQGISTQYFGRRVGRGSGWCRLANPVPKRGYHSALEHDLLYGYMQAATCTSEKMGLPACTPVGVGGI